MGGRFERGGRALVVATLVLAIMLLPAALAGCAGADDASTTTTPGVGMRGGGEASPAKDGATATSAAAAGTAEQAIAGQAATPQTDAAGQVGSLTAALTSLDRKVVSTANLQVEVAKGKFQSAFDQALAIAERYGGYVVSSQSTATAEESALRSGTITLRIPSVSFSRALRDTAALGTVKSRQVDSEDVTDQFVDLEARLKNAQSQAAALQDLLVRAKTVEEILQVRQVLSNTQQEIEQLKGQLQYLKEHTSYGTMTVGLFEVGTVVAVAAESGWGFVQALEDALRGFVETMNGLIVGFGSALPVLILLGVAAWIAYRVYRWREAREAGSGRVS